MHRLTYFCPICVGFTRQLETTHQGCPDVAYCTSCGRVSESFETRHAKCTQCDHIDWSNPVPAVGVAILRGEEILLAKRGREPKKGHWDLVGGFVEPGETAKQAIAREVVEETGMTLRGLELVDILPGDYAGRASLNMLYIGQADGDPVAADDVAALKWYKLESLPVLAWPHERDMLQTVAAMLATLKAQVDG